MEDFSLTIILLKQKSSEIQFLLTTVSVTRMYEEIFSVCFVQKYFGSTKAYQAKNRKRCIWIFVFCFLFFLCNFWLFSFITYKNVAGGFHQKRTTNGQFIKTCFVSISFINIKYLKAFYNFFSCFSVFIFKRCLFQAK